MVRETRHLWVGNLPENIREDRIREHFKRYGRVQSVKLLPRTPEEKTGEVQMACTVAFMDIKSAAKAHNAELKIDERTLNTKYYEPAAIPSSAAPRQGTPPPYSTTSSSPGGGGGPPASTRFPNGHGSSDEHGYDLTTNDVTSRFYDRQGGVGAAPTSAPEGGSGTCRGGRNRERFRGGSGGGGRGSASVWGNSISGVVGGGGYADTSRYSNSNERSQSDTTGYSSAPSSDDRRNSDSVRKKAKSRSGSRSASPNGSTSSRSPSRSRSRSSSSSSSSSTSRATTSSTSSRRSRRHRRHYKKPNLGTTSGISANSEDRRPLGIRVSNLPVRSSDTSLKDGLFHEYKKHGKVTWVKVVGQNADRHAIVCFKKPEDAEKALEVSYDKLFFGCKIEVEPHSVCDIDEVECRYESEIDEYNPKATRTLFIGNLEKDVTASDLRKHFDQFGEIIEIDIKKQGAVSSYAFCQYSDIVSVVKAIRKMDGEHLGNNRIKLGFGKSMAYNCVWIDGVTDSVTEKYLRIQFEPFGSITKCVIDREKNQALVFYEHVSQAQLAVSKMRGFLLKNVKLQVDFASRECQECFFERLEKQQQSTGTLFDSTSRNFDSSATSRLTARYADTPTRPRTSSYSSRSSVAAMASPGTPGNVTPRGGRARVRYYDYELDYAAATALDSSGRHSASHRSYDEYSQGSAASHEDPYDPYDHPTGYLHDSPGHLDPLEVRVVQNLVDPVPYPPHDIRNLQKERVHLLEQLEECPSSGDELISPKKRLKLDLLDPSVGDVIIEANRDHRKVMEVRRLSEASLRHHARRPSIDNKYGYYAPNTVGCKRRRTGGSDGGIRGHSHYPDHSDGSDLAGSRPGTPLCDENPEFPLGEPPKRTITERGEGPMILPLPKWAAQVRSTPEFQRSQITVSGIKGQKEHVNPLASPPSTAATSPRVSTNHHQLPQPPPPVVSTVVPTMTATTTIAPRPPSPSQHVPPPASPPPRPPSLSSNSSDSDNAATGSPSLEERIRSLDEKYEKWSGSRALSAAGNDALAMLDANREKFRLRHKLLEIQDLKEVQPSEIVKSVMAKRSVFDEDLKRLESVGEKYEPKDFGLFCRLPNMSTTSGLPSSNSVSSVPSLSVMNPSLKLPTTSVGAMPQQQQHQVPKPPVTTISPRSTPSITTAISRALQYPFPSHPPILTSMSSPVASSSTTSSTTTSSTSVTVRNPNLGENRLKSTATVPGDSRTSSVKNRSSTIGMVPLVSDLVSGSNGSASKSLKPMEKVILRRNSSSTSPRADIKTRRNSDTSARRIDCDSDKGKNEEKQKEEAERHKKELQEEKQRQEKEKEAETEKIRLEKERLQREKEKERAKLEKLKLEKEEQEKREAQEKEEREREQQKTKELKNKDYQDNHHHHHSKHRENHSDSTKPSRENNTHHLQNSDNFDNQKMKLPNYDRRDHHHVHDNHIKGQKDSIKENRDNNIHKSIGETRHMSLELDKEAATGKKKERNNSLPANVGVKRRMSSYDSMDSLEEAKKIKLLDHKKISERRDSKDSNKSDERSKSKNKHKNNSIHDKEEMRRKEKEREERHKHKHKLEKQKSKSKSREKEGRETSVEVPLESSMNDKDFLAKLNLRSNEEIEKEKQEKQKKEFKERRVEKLSIDKQQPSQQDKEKSKKERIRKITNTSDSDSDEPKKHSIFDIVDDGPPYISMYDKVKARSCKNMQKQEEEKRQEKIKAKFSQLKLSRARREEKKRSTSWDEDSDSDKETEIKSRRSRKLLDSSDESQERKTPQKRKEPLNSDSDNSLLLRPIKTEPLETTDEDIKVKEQIFRSHKPRIGSDSSDEEYQKKMTNNKMEYSQDRKLKFFEDDTDVDMKPEKLTTVKNELERLVKKERRNSAKFQSFSSLDQKDYDSPDVKSEKFNNRSMFDNTTDDDVAETKKKEKKHKKKQKKQKHSASSEESCKVEADSSLVDMQEKKHHDKKKEHSSKKDKKRDKIKESRDKSRKPKKNKLTSEIKSEIKREGKLENIFGSLSEDSEAGSKDPNTDFLVDENAQPPTYTDSEKEQEKNQEEREREAEHKRKKEKKRREKERRIQEAVAAASEEPPHSNDNSMDLADMCKQLEANIKDDTCDMDQENSEANFSFTDQEVKRDERKESKEKKKKRKKGKDEKKHHHHHHHEKITKPKTPEIKQETEETKVEPLKEAAANHNQSLPSLEEIQSPLSEKISPETHKELGPILSPISKPKREILPGFGGEIDEVVHENAVKSIADPIVTKIEVKEENDNEELLEEGGTQDKPRTVISQEETEDAVAALLGESFGSAQFEERCYPEEIMTTSTEEPQQEIVEDPNVQDDEEMRQAVQSLEVDGEMSKPDTPQSEHDLQIDTDTEQEAEDTERSKTPSDIPQQPQITAPYKSLSSPPSLTPIKQLQTDVKKPLEESKVIPERTVIAQTWPTERKELVVVKTDNSVSPQLTTPPTIKVIEPNYPPLAKLSPNDKASDPPQNTSSTVLIQPSRHNLPVQVCKPQEPSVPSPKSPGGVILNRLPITSVAMTKPIQASTTFLPQPKVATHSEPPKLVASCMDKPPHVAFHPPNVPPPSYTSFPAGGPPRMVLQTSGGLLVPTNRPISPSSYGQFASQTPSYVPLQLKEVPKPALMVSAGVQPPLIRTTTSVVNVPQLVSTISKPIQDSSSCKLPDESTFVTPTSSPGPKPVPVISVESNQTECAPPIKIPTPEPARETKPINLSVPPLESRTSTPSPVIVANPEILKTEVKSPVKEIQEDSLNLTVVKKEEPIKEEKDSPKVEETPKVEVLVKAEVAEIKETLTKEEVKDNDYWSAKDSLNIDSVIKTLNSIDEVSEKEKSIEIPTEESPKLELPDQSEEEKKPIDIPISENKNENEDLETNDDSPSNYSEDEQKPETLSVTRSAARRGRGGRARGKTVKSNIQTRRGKLKEVVPSQTTIPVNKRGRGGKARTERKSSKSESESTTNDVYEFREDSDDSNKEQRPRLVLTIKSTTSSTSNTQATAIVKEITKDGTKEIGKEILKDGGQTKTNVGGVTTPIEESKEEFTSPQTGCNTRKSRRLAEKDVSRNTVDDTIEDVVKNTPLTRAAYNQRRSGRQQKKAPAVVEADLPRKSTRGRKPCRRSSETTENSSSEDIKDDTTGSASVSTINTSTVKSPEAVTTKPEVEQEKPKEPVEIVKEKKVDHCSLKTAMLKRFKGEMNANKAEATSLIDPVTGMLIPMRESEEGKYIPLPGSSPGEKKTIVNESAKAAQPSVIAQPHQVTVVQQTVPKVHPLKAHVLSSQAAKAITELVPVSTSMHPPIMRESLPQVASPSPTVVMSKPGTPVLISRSGTPITSTIVPMTLGPLSPRPGAPVAEVKPQVKPPMLSPSQQLLLTNHKHMLQAREQLQAHLNSASKQGTQIINTHVAHMKHPQVIMGGGGATKVPTGLPKTTQHPLHQQHLPGQIVSPPITKGSPLSQVMSGTTQKSVIDSPKMDVTSIMLGRPNLSPSGTPARLASGLSVPAYEASLMADARAYYNRSSPPPAHQNSPHSPKGEPMAHFPPGPLRPPDLNPAHYMHPQNMMYQQFLRQQHFQRPVGLEKSGEEGEEAPVGLAVRGAAVPHHSPDDRATESPAIGQVYNSLTARLPYHAASRYFDQPTEPPPAHRPLHDRGQLPHLPPLATAAHSGTHLIPDRPTGVIPERPLSAHLAHERAPVSAERPQTSSYGPERPLVWGGLGAAGNLVAAVAKHIGVDVPAGQRGDKFGEPKLASLVPPMAESLFMQLKVRILNLM
ncbi:hypothetical protein ABEB36_008866 [Hypothenemus hampei]|uniref:RRM domain-containing protein n=1 Tax=Hypothenemus hampei TaxID=57062 RepID=A0ABD1ENC6_HYPHA